jgi:glyoxylase I family protein
LRAGNGCAIELVSFANPPERVSNLEACGLRHLAFAVEDIEALVNYLKSQKVAVEETRFI